MGIVKFGLEITIAEGQCLWAMKHLLEEKVPVPEVYGWCKDGKDVFIYMELVDGVTLEDRWDSLSTEERIEICKQLDGMMKSLRLLEQDPDDKFIGHIGRQPLQDVIFECSPVVPGPFPTMKAYHDFFAFSTETPHPYRHFLPDNLPIAFTHGDLHRSNIIVSPIDAEGQPRVLAIIDWHQSGWLPNYWEFSKARWCVAIGEEWEAEYLPRFVEPCEWWDYWRYFILARGM